MTSALDLAAEYGFSQFLSMFGQAVTLRNVKLFSGANPYPNPPVYSGLFVNGAAAQGAGSLNLRSNNCNGRLLSGDKLLLAGDATVYTVGGTVESASNGFTAVPISPVLAQAHNDGDAVTPTFAADASITALVTSFSARLVNGSSIQATDKQIRFLASAIGFTPQTTDKAFIGTDQYSIIAVKAIQVQGSIYAWSCHLRR